MEQIDDFNLEGNFPVIVTPQNVYDYEEFLQKIQLHKPQLEQLLLKHGALLFRGFPVNSAESFKDVIKSFNLGSFVNYVGGNSPRSRIDEKVYTAIEAPSSAHIPLHQEFSFMNQFPQHVYFFCAIAPISGGETIIADARRIYETLDSDVKHRFQEQYLTYISNYGFKSKMTRSWTEVFETEDKINVEEKCLKHQISWRWLQRNWLELKQSCPAMLSHPHTKELVWFNQAHLYDNNPRLLGWKKYFGTKISHFRKTTQLHDVTFSDGKPIPRNDVYHILDVLDANTVSYPWQRNDVLILDNILAMHGRNPFSGQRKILTALTSKSVS